LNNVLPEERKKQKRRKRRSLKMRREREHYGKVGEKVDA